MPFPFKIPEALAAGLFLDNLNASVGFLRLNMVRAPKAPLTLGLSKSEGFGKPSGFEEPSVSAASEPLYAIYRHKSRCGHTTSQYYFRVNC